MIRLFYYGPSATTGDPATLLGPHSIYSATSSDGINFKEEPGVRFAYESITPLGITDPDVVRLNDGSWLMFLSIGSNLLKATSPVSSGIFAWDPSFSWNLGGVPGSFNFGGSIRTFVCALGGIQIASYDQNNGILNLIGTALGAPASGMIADPSVIQVGNKYLMIYKYATSASAPPTQHQIYISTSTDGINWTQHSENKLICKGSVPSAAYYKGVIYIYYCGLSQSTGVPKADMGVAISRDNGATFTFSTITIQGRAAAGAVDPCAIVVNP